MYIFVKNLTKLKMPQPCHGKQLAYMARDSFIKNQGLVVDFDGLENITQGFFQEFFLPLVTEFGAEFLKCKLQVKNVGKDNQEIMDSAFNNLDDYFEKLAKINNKHCDKDTYDLNLSWLVRAREVCRENAVHAQLFMGINTEEMRLAISRLSVEEIQLIAQSGCLCFEPRFSANFIQSMTSGEHDMVDILLSLDAWS
ncbi:MAG: STAS-like domain-containing protein [Methylomonas sp.]